MKKQVSQIQAAGKDKAVNVKIKSFVQEATISGKESFIVSSLQGVINLRWN